MIAHSEVAEASRRSGGGERGGRDAITILRDAVLGIIKSTSYVLALTLIVMLATAAGAGAATYVFAIAEGREFSQRPAEITSPTVVSVETPLWNDWGSSAPTATGTAYISGGAIGDPTTSNTATVTLSNRRRCGGKLYYRDVRISYVGNPALELSGPKGWSTKCVIYLLDPFPGTSPDRAALVRPRNFYLGDIPFDDTKWRGWNSARAFGRSRQSSRNYQRLALFSPRVCDSEGGILIYSRHSYAGKYKGRRFGGGGRLPGC